MATVLVLTLSSAMAGACGSDSTKNVGGPAVTTTTIDTAAAAKDPRYQGDGPHAVGVTTVRLADGRAVEVYYPATDAATTTPFATYLQTDGVPADLLAKLPPIPAGTNLTVQLPAHRDVAADATGPFPLVLFSHGAGGWRGVYGMQLSGLASWGFVVASIDFAEYGLLASFGGGTPDRSGVTKVAIGAADQLIAESGRAGSLIAGSIDGSKIAGMGHSAGGGTMFTLLDEPRIATIIGWAPVGPPVPVTSTTPTLIVAGSRDIAITPDKVTASYDALKAPKRLVTIDKMGHNGFGDSCLAIRSGTDLIGIAKGLGLPIPDRLLELGKNGCGTDDLDTRTGWAVTQHFTVAHLREVFKIDGSPVGLGDDIANAFPGVGVTYRHED